MKHSGLIIKTLIHITAYYIYNVSYVYNLEDKLIKYFQYCEIFGSTSTSLSRNRPSIYRGYGTQFALYGGVFCHVKVDESGRRNVPT